MSLARLDCRMFPFDIDRDEKGDPVWILYNSTCPTANDDALAHFSEIEDLAEDIRPHVGEFADHSSPQLKNHNHTMIGRVKGVPTKQDGHS